MYLYHYACLSLLFFCTANAGTVVIPWTFGSALTHTVNVGDVLRFMWTGTSTHTVGWQNSVFTTSAASSTQGHTVEYTIQPSHAEQTLVAYCTIHPSMTETVIVGAGSTTNSPTVAPTMSPAETGSTFSPTVSPSLWPTGNPNPFALLGYYPLYTTEYAANAAGDGTSHTHVLNNVTHWMPNGVTGWHGNYTQAPTRSPGETHTPSGSPSLWPTGSPTVWPTTPTVPPTNAPTPTITVATTSPTSSPTGSPTDLSTGEIAAIAIGGSFGGVGIGYGVSRLVMKTAARVKFKPIHDF